MMDIIIEIINKIINIGMIIKNGAERFQLSIIAFS